MATTHREYVLEVFSDQHFVRDIVKGMICRSGSAPGPRLTATLNSRLTMTSW